MIRIADELGRPCEVQEIWSGGVWAVTPALAKSRPFVALYVDRFEITHVPTGAKISGRVGLSRDAALGFAERVFALAPNMCPGAEFGRLPVQDRIKQSLGDDCFAALLALVAEIKTAALREHEALPPGMGIGT